MKHLSFYNKNILALGTVFALSCTALSPAFGLDKDTFSKRLNNTTEAMLIELSSDNIEVNNNNVVYHDTVVKYKDEDGNKDEDGQINLGDVYFDNIKEEDGRYVIGSVRLPDISEKSDQAKFDAKGIKIDNLILPDADNASLSSTGLIYENLLIKEFTYSWKDKPLFVAKGIENHYSSFDKKTPIEMSNKVDSFTFDSKSTDDAQTIEAMKALDLETLTGSAYSTGTWDAFGTGALNIDEYVIKVDNAGLLKGNVSLTGLTESVVSSMKEFKQTKTSDDKQAMAAMAILQQIKIKDIKVRYENSGFVEKLLDLVAKEQGTTSASLKELIKQMLPIAASNLQSPAFAEEVTAATNTFIDNPKSLEITAQPKDEVSLAALAMVGAMGQKAPANIIKLLNIHLTANK